LCGSTDAETRLREIYYYYLGEAGERTARKITDRIIKAGESLGKMPFSAPVELLLEDRPEGYRSKVVKSLHKIVYHVTEGRVNIVTVFDCRRDPEHLRESATGEKKRGRKNS
jgi:plasmid stabilization system protein ParE